jgi:hypothetical protein
MLINAQPTAEVKKGFKRFRLRGLYFLIRNYEPLGISREKAYLTSKTIKTYLCIQVNYFKQQCARVLYGGANA